MMDISIGGAATTFGARYFAATLCLSVLLVTCAAAPTSASSSFHEDALQSHVTHTTAGVTVNRAHAKLSSPTFNNTLYGTNFNLSKVGYEKSQFTLSGTAHSFVPTNALSSDGKWKVTTGVSAPYTTRIAVYRPINPKRFNGTVMVEWLNVSGGTDDAPDWTLSHNELIRDGFAWVGVSCTASRCRCGQKTDPAEVLCASRIQATAIPTTCSPRPGRPFAGTHLRFSIWFTAPRIDCGRRVTVGWPAHDLHRCRTTDHPRVSSGSWCTVNSGTGAPLSEAPQSNYAAPNPTTIRSDIGVPVFEFETETDVDNSNLTDRLHYGNPKWFRL